jgi:hypothetical protein
VPFRCGYSDECFGYIKDDKLIIPAERVSYSVLCGIGQFKLKIFRSL